MSKVLKGKVICVALNDQQYLDLLTEKFEQPPHKALPTEPVLYFKPRNTWNQDDSPIPCLNDNDQLVVGASLAVIIGETCCRVAEESAMQYVQGFALLHDFSLPETSYYRPDIKGKCLDNSATLSEPVLVSDVSDFEELEVVTSVNGSVQRSFPISRQSRSVQNLIHKVSHIMTLEKGDVIAVGFAGKRLELKPNDRVQSTFGQALSLENVIAGGK